MNEEPRSEFPATALIDTHVKVLDVAGAGDEVLEAVKDLVSMGRIGDEPEVVLDTSGVRHLVWRGYLMGGLITVWLRLGPALRSAGLPASAKSHQPRDLGIELVEENRFLAARDGWPRKTAPRASLPTFVRRSATDGRRARPRVLRGPAVRTSSGALSPGSPVRDGRRKIINSE